MPNIPTGFWALGCLYMVGMAGLFLSIAISSKKDERAANRFLQSAVRANCRLIDLGLELDICGGGDASVYPCLHVWGIYQYRGLTSPAGPAWNTTAEFGGGLWYAMGQRDWSKNTALADARRAQAQEFEPAGWECSCSKLQAPLTVRVRQTVSDVSQEAKKSRVEFIWTTFGACLCGLGYPIVWFLYEFYERRQLSPTSPKEEKAKEPGPGRV